MSGLDDAAKRAREIADTSTDPGDHAVANALEGALAAARMKGREPAVELANALANSGIPTPEEAGYPASLRIPPGESGLN